jgi:hypothetical protein
MHLRDITLHHIKIYYRKIVLHCIEHKGEITLYYIYSTYSRFVHCGVIYMALFPNIYMTKQSILWHCFQCFFYTCTWANCNVLPYTCICIILCQHSKSPRRQLSRYSGCCPSILYGTAIQLFRALSLLETKYISTCHQFRARRPTCSSVQSKPGCMIVNSSVFLFIDVLQIEWTAQSRTHPLLKVNKVDCLLVTTNGQNKFCYFEVMTIKHQ